MLDREKVYSPSVEIIFLNISVPLIAYKDTMSLAFKQGNIIDSPSCANEALSSCIFLMPVT